MKTILCVAHVIDSWTDLEKEPTEEERYALTDGICGVLGKADLLPCAVGWEDDRYLYLVFPRSFEGTRVGDVLREVLITIHAEQADRRERAERAKAKAKRPGAEPPRL